MATSKKVSKKKVSKKKTSKRPANRTAKKKTTSRKKAASKKTASRKKTTTKKNTAQKKATPKQKIVRVLDGKRVSAETLDAVNKAVEARISGKTVVGKATITMMNPKNIVVEDGFNNRIDMGDIPGLMKTIKRNGLEMPLIVRKVGKHYELVAGHRRLVAALRLGLDKVPTIVKTAKMSDAEALLLSLVSNDSKALAPVEEAVAFRRLVKGGMTPKAIATATGKSLRTVKDRLTLIAAHPDVREAVRSGKLSFSLGVNIAKKSKGDKKKQRQQVKKASRSKEGKKKVAAQVGRQSLNVKIDKKKVALQNRLNKLVDIANKRLDKKDKIPGQLSSQINRFSTHSDREVRAAFVAGGIAAFTDVLTDGRTAKAKGKKPTARAKSGSKRRGK